MQNLKIIKYPNSILRKKCEEVKEITDEIKKFCQDMIEIMILNHGVGLAASQVGELKRIIAVCPIQEKEIKTPQIFINPKITKKSKKTEIDEEGCLSFPGLFLKIKRASEVEVEALDLEGKEVKIKANGYLARIFQHEIDHLNGILFIDRINFWQRLRLKLKLKVS